VPSMKRPLLSRPLFTFFLFAVSLASPSPTMSCDGEARETATLIPERAGAPQRQEEQAKAVTAPPLSYGAGAAFAGDFPLSFAVCRSVLCPSEQPPFPAGPVSVSHLSGVACAPHDSVGLECLIHPQMLSASPPQLPEVQRGIGTAGRSLRPRHSSSAPLFLHRSSMTMPLDPRSNSLRLKVLLPLQHRIDRNQQLPRYRDPPRILPPSLAMRHPLVQLP
jgi:hypothetical protein